MTTATAAGGIVIDKDVAVPMRDGARLMADVFRPKGDGRVPALLNLGPYQKDKLWVVPPALEEKQNDWMNWETVNPEWWVPRGYACVRVDGRGSGRSPGQCEPWSLAEAIDFHDAIEWAAAQPWCNGKVGLTGISYYAINQWFVANQQPPSLKAMIPWEGFADIYRDALYHGGLLNVFMTNWFTAHLMHHKLGRASQTMPDAWKVNTLDFWLSNNLDSGAFHGAQAQWDRITVPFLSVGNWTGFGLHLRGNTEAFARAASKHKKLRIHTGSHVHPFYTEEGRQDQVRFFDYWLKGIDNGVMDEPPVKLAIRHGADKIVWRHEQEWPLARTQWTKLYFDLAPQDGAPEYSAKLVRENPKAAHTRSYVTSHLGTMGSTSAASSQVMGGGGIRPNMGVALETPPLDADMEVTGPLAASFWVSSESEDMDLFLTLRHFDENGTEIMETGQQGAPVPVAKGWLRVSHRELDPKLSTPGRPYHAHKRRLYLKPGEIVKVDVEIWPTSMVFKKGHRIRLDVQPRDGVGSQGYMHYHADYNSGRNTIHAGGQYESYLLLPVIPG
ncbi:MAG TPA: CocE/NonD family hydrolase [Pseudolabrys sp.]|uniref:CocE/NonD family hydrolase n=1 Tax=Pseudolabrys sp. TaxID=1960880 RepID=UPI002DDCD465|nr:CocE/NonD family hydrolase [Pseudolabrys sp.]HEV2630722.1 CocE/NonD family hydrolase [Pseudolabrys sp.]